MDKSVGGRKEGRMDRQIDKNINGWMDEQMKALTLQRCTEIGSFGAHKIFILCTVQHGQTVPMYTLTRVFCCLCVVSGTDGLTGLPC